MKPAVFLDRDGTIIKEKDHLCYIREIDLLPDAAWAIRLLRKAGFFLVVVTNQAAVAKGLLTEEQLAIIHARLQQLLRREGAWLDALYYCPHHPENGYFPYQKTCACRKPEPAMLLQAAREHNLCLESSFLIGDTLTDMEAGRRAGCRTILVRTGYGEQELTSIWQAKIFPDFVVNNLSEAAFLIFNERIFLG